MEYAGEDKTAEVDLSANRYTEYFIITRDYVEQVEKILARDQYRVDFDVDSSNTTVYDKDKSEHTIPGQLVYTTGRKYSNNLQSNTIEANGKKYTYSSSKVDNAIVFSSFAQAVYNTRIAEIDAYNQAITNLLKDAPNLTTTEFNTRLADDNITPARYNQLKALTVSYNENTSDSSNVIYGIDDKEDYLKYIILKRFCADNDFSLDGFTLLNLDDKVTDSTNTKAVGVYVPQWTSTPLDKDKDSRANYIRENGFISFENPITISGIGNDAFNREGRQADNLDPVSVDITRLVLSDQVDFIGKNAFRFQSTLGSVIL